MTRCTCGNPLSPGPVEFEVTHSPCMCDAPGPRSSFARSPWTPSWVSKRQYDSRKREGLPVVTPAEQAAKRVLEKA